MRAAVLRDVSLQKALKEKEEHVEQLLRERDLERSEVARAAAQVDKVCWHSNPRPVYRSCRFVFAWNVLYGNNMLCSAVS